MTLISRLLVAALPARRRPSRLGSVVIRSCWSATRFPRFHIGESLLSTANDAFAALGVAERIEAACFPRSGVRACSLHDARSGRYVDFTDVREVTRPQTYQVCRQQFDHILLERAREVGVDVREACDVIACEFAPDAAILDVACRVDAATRRMRVRALVDATGRGGLIARKFNLRTEEPQLAKVSAIFSHYTAYRDWKVHGPTTFDLSRAAMPDGSG